MHKYFLVFVTVTSKTSNPIPNTDHYTDRSSLEVLTICMGLYEGWFDWGTVAYKLMQKYVHNKPTETQNKITHTYTDAHA